MSDLEESSQDVNVSSQIENVTQALKDAGVSEESIKASASTLEEEAKSKGWRPDGPKTAKEFLDDEPFYQELKARGKEIKELKQTIDELKAHFDVEREAGYKQAIEDLKRQRSDAIAIGDEASVDRIEQTLEQYKKDDPKPVDILSIPSVKEFQERNKEWLSDVKSYEHVEMQEFFTKRDKQLLALNLPIDEHVRTVEEDMHKRFPNYFNKKGQSSGMVSSVADAVPTGNVTRSKKFSFRDLNEVQQSVCRRFVKNGVMTEDKYIESLVKSGELK